jgi:putative Mg2+ transporter-C (MgtC) family protein
MLDVLIALLAIDFSDPLVVTFIADICIALILGALIGAEREIRGKDAGMSTNMFVMCGAMLFTIMSISVDPASQSRIAAQIVTGIGFLGAGLILKDGDKVKNLTTAASVWFSGAIGMTLGFGYHEIAIIGALVALIIPRIPHVRKEVREAYARKHKNDADEGTDITVQSDD